MDRNIVLTKKLNRPPPSLSARRAWIEMLVLVLGIPTSVVALRKESVDRNRRPTKSRRIMPLSLSARRAWIEIAMSNGK